MKIFITYSRSNQNEVTSLVKDLEELGHDIWYDQDLSGGQSWWDNILSKIRGCDLYIFAITPEALDSTACKRELKYAEALRRNSLPVLMRPDVSMAMAPRYLSNMQYVNYCNPGEKTAVFALLKAINNLPAPQSLPDPLPTPPDVPISYLDTLKEKIEAKSLDKKDQMELLGDLKLRLDDPDTKSEDVLKLLKKLRRHDDLLASVGAEIDEVISEFNQTGRENKKATAQPHYSEERKKPEPPAYTQPVNMPQTKIADSSMAITKPGDSWSSGIMVLLVIGSLIIPLLGIIMGIVGITAGKGKKSQGIILLVVAFIAILIYAGISGGNSY
jgi:hypothetical protein